MRWNTPLLLTAVLLALTGCGDAGAKRLTHDEYLAALRQIEASASAAEVVRRFDRLAVGDLGRKECRREARTFANDARSIVDSVARLSPPADAEDLQRRFVVAAGRTADQLDQLADDVAAGRVTCGTAWNRRAYGLPSTSEAQRVLDAYAGRGYLLDSNSGD